MFLDKSEYVCIDCYGYRSLCCFQENKNLCLRKLPPVSQACAHHEEKYITFLDIVFQKCLSRGNLSEQTHENRIQSLHCVVQYLRQFLKARRIKYTTNLEGGAQICISCLDNSLPIERQRHHTSANNEQQPFAMSGRLGPIARKNYSNFSIISCFSYDNKFSARRPIRYHLYTSTVYCLHINIAELLRI